MEHPNRIKALSQAALVTGIFCTMVSLLLLVNFWQTRRVQPLDNVTIQVLVERLAADPTNEALKNEIRTLDLVARKAYFTSEWQVQTGGFMLLFGSIALLIFLKLRKDLTDKIERPSDDNENLYLARFRAQRWILVIAMVIFTSALVASFMTSDYLSKYGTPEWAASQEQPEPEEAIEKISLQPAPHPLTPSPTGEGEPAPHPLTASSQEEREPATRNLQPSSSPSLADLHLHHPTFRGAWGGAMSKHTNIPVDWDGPSGRNILWKTELKKPGFNSPVWWGDRLFITGGNAQGLAVYCYDRHTGKLLWEHPVTGVPGSPATMPKTTDDTGLAAPTVCTDGTHVCAIFATGDLVALDMEGNRLWARNLGVPDNHYGHSSSLVAWQEKLIVLFDTNRSGRLLAINISTGETIYDIPRKSKISWTTPILVQVNGSMQIVTSTAPTVAGHDFETGKELWSVDCMMGEVGPSPVAGDGLVFAANEYATMVAINPIGPTVVWEDNELLPEVSSLAHLNGLLYIATSYGIFACYDAKTGEKLWEDDTRQPFYGSPMVAEDKIYIIDMKGVMHIYKAGREMVKAGTPALGESSVVTPAFAPGRIYLKGNKYLYAIGEK